MDESVVKVFEEQKVGAVKFSHALREGAKTIRETHYTHCGCAIGTAYKYVTGVRLTMAADGSEDSYVMAVSRLFGIPRDIVAQAELQHLCYGASREQIADQLEAQGY
jgi:hypothetical protein